MKWANGILILLLAAVSVVAFENWKEAEKLRREIESLQRGNQTLQEELAAATAKQSAIGAAEQEQQRKNSEELLRLRSEATQLRAKAAEEAKLRSENQQLRAAIPAAANASVQSTNAAPTGHQFPRDSWTFSGYATPEATLVSAIWAMREGNPRAYLDSLSPEEQARQGKQWEGKSEADVAAKHQQDVASITGFQILSSQTISPNEVQMSVFVAGPDKTEMVSLVRNGNDWKFAGFVPSPPKQ